MTKIPNLRLVEIELHSYCNRKCKWCPNNYIDRKSDCYYLDEALFRRLIKELAENQYEGRISFSRYNEPFYDTENLNNCIKIIKEHLPNVVTVSNTNGDYITREVLGNMLIDELSIMDYDSNNKSVLLDRLTGWGVTNILDYGNYLVGTFGNKKVLYYCSWNDVAEISDRGGNLEQYSKTVRDYPCYEPLYFVGINYDGTVSPCCNIRNDCDNQKLYIIGDLNKQSLADILRSKRYMDFVEKVTKSKYDPSMPCYYCINKGGRYTKKDGGILYE